MARSYKKAKQQSEGLLDEAGVDQQFSGDGHEIEDFRQTFDPETYRPSSVSAYRKSLVNAHKQQQQPQPSQQQQHSQAQQGDNYSLSQNYNSLNIDIDNDPNNKNTSNNNNNKNSKNKNSEKQSKNNKKSYYNNNKNKNKQNKYLLKEPSVSSNQYSEFSGFSNTHHHHNKHGRLSKNATRNRERSKIMNNSLTGSMLFSTIPRGSHIVPQAFKQDDTSMQSQKSFEKRKLTSLARAGIINDEDTADKSQLKLKDKKWHILFCCVFCFASTFHCLLSLSALEESVINEYNGLNSSGFAALTTVSFAFAMVSAIVIPYWINKYDLYKIVIFAQICVTIGQGLTAYSDIMNENNNIYIYVLYVGRGFVGFGLGIDSVAIQAITGLWFRESPKQAFAFALINNSIEVGIVTALYILVPISELTNGIFWPLSFGLIWALLSVQVAFYMLYIENSLSKTREINDKQSTKLEANIFKAFKEINNNENQWVIWGVIIVLFCGKGIVDTFSNETQAIFTETYNMSESTADWCISVTAFVGIGAGWLIGSLIGKIGQFSKTLMLATGLMALGIIGLSANSEIAWLNVFGNVGNNDNSSFGNHYLPWIATLVLAFGLEMFFIAGYSSLFTVIPINLMSFASSFVAVLTYGSSMVGTFVYGFISEKTNDSSAMLFLGGWALISFIWSIEVHFVDGKHEKLLRDMGPQAH